MNWRKPSPQWHPPFCSNTRRSAYGTENDIENIVVARELVLLILPLWSSE